MSTSKLKLTEALNEWMGVFMQHSMRENMQYWRESKLSMPQGIVLTKLYRTQTCGVSDVAEFMDVTPAAASQMVEKMVQLGYLERTEDPVDRRVKQVTLSPKGKDMVQKSLHARMAWFKDLTQTLSEEDQSSIANSIATLIRVTRELESRVPEPT
jgi:MarR family transcriptional regulator, organic hydroperoxide resistance regulator